MPIDLTAEPTKRIGLVLGGGGIAGMAFHAGVLLALHHDLGWDARDADVIVGTSAGSIVGALLRAGVTPEDLAAWATDATPTQDGRKFRALMLHADRARAGGTGPAADAARVGRVQHLRSPHAVACRV